MVFENAKKFGFKVRITTNGVSFNEKYCKILSDNFNCLVKPISISIIGSNSEKVKKYMSVNFDVTLERLKKVKIFQMCVSNSKLIRGRGR